MLAGVTFVTTVVDPSATPVCALLMKYRLFCNCGVPHPASAVTVTVPLAPAARFPIVHLTRPPPVLDPPALADTNTAPVGS